MVALNWTGVGDYDVFIQLSLEEMKELTDYYQVDWSFFTTEPAKNFDNRYFCFASFSRKVLALLPFLSLAFGGMYDELPMEGPERPITLNYSEFRLEEFSMESRKCQPSDPDSDDWS